MNPPIFLHSDIPDPYTIYEQMLKENPVFYDELHQVFICYTYRDCKTILESPLAEIPEISSEGLNEKAGRIARELTRLSNGNQHFAAREITVSLFRRMKYPPVESVLSEIMEKDTDHETFDFVKIVPKEFPVLFILKAFDFNKYDCDFFTENSSVLIQIMSPGKTEAQVNIINPVAGKVYDIVKRHITSSKFLFEIVLLNTAKFTMDEDEIISLAVSNLIGLLIQSYDAARGLLSNAFLQYLFKNQQIFNPLPDILELKKFVLEVSRIDPAIHNTRRIAKANIVLESCTIPQGGTMVLMLAAANRDVLHFKNARVFDDKRANNEEQLTFGFGNHACIAKHFSINLAAEVLLYFCSKYERMTLLNARKEYEPLVNARLLKHIFISIK